MVYEEIPGVLDPSPGVYIQDIEGYFIKESEWKSDLGRIPNGIAVITDTLRFLIALKDAYTGMCSWAVLNDTHVLIEGVTATSQESEALLDFDGLIQTDIIIAELGEVNAPAASFCKNFIFPNGEKGYLGALGEWNAALANKPAIQSALTKCGAEKIWDDEYWTSTQVNEGRSWYVYWGIASIDPYGENKHYPYNFVRAFAPLPFKLPSDYTELPYISGTGHQYIDTGIVAKNNIRVVLKCEVKSLSSTINLFGSMISGKRIYIHYDSGLYYGYGAYKAINNDIYVNRVYEFDALFSYGEQYLKINGETVYSNSENINIDTGYNAYLFALNSSGIASNFAQMNLYSCKIYRDGFLVRDCIPCRNRNLECGLYDKVNNEFYSSDSSTPFIFQE